MLNRLLWVRVVNFVVCLWVSEVSFMCCFGDRVRCSI